MTRRVWTLVAAVAVMELAGPGLHAADSPGVSISGPSPDQTPVPATAPATAPATQPAPSPVVPATQNSADAALSNLLNAPTAAPLVPAATLPGKPEVTPAAAGVAPDQPAVNRLREGQPVWNRLGRLQKDESGTGYMFAFESDGKALQDPPMPLLPCRMLQQMEAASADGSKPVKFKISGQVTEYHGKNYLLVNFMQATKDLGRGLE